MTEEQKKSYPIGYEVTHTKREELGADPDDRLSSFIANNKAYVVYNRVNVYETLAEITHYCDGEIIGIKDHWGNESEVPLEEIKLTEESKKLLERSQNIDDLS